MTELSKMTSYIMPHENATRISRYHSERHYGECHNAECCYTDCRSAIKGWGVRAGSIKSNQGNGTNILPL